MGEPLPPPPETRRKQVPSTSKRSAPQTREVPCPEKQSRRSPEASCSSRRNSAPVPSKNSSFTASTSFFQDRFQKRLPLKPLIPKKTSPQAGDKQSPLQFKSEQVSFNVTDCTKERRGTATFKMKRSTPLKKLKDAYAEKYNIRDEEKDCFRFLYYGKPIYDNAT